VKPDLWVPARTPPRRREALAGIADLHEYPPQVSSPGRLGRGDMLVADHDLTAALDAISRIDGLRVVQTMSAGVDRIVDQIPAGITLCDASGVHDIGVAEWIVMAILASNRRLLNLIEGQRAASWRYSEAARGDDLEGSRVLILGYGSIGRAVEDRLVPFGVAVDRVARHERDGVHSQADLPDLVPLADILIVLLPLTPATRRFVGTEILSHMKPGALLVNASRGAVVDTDALMAALADGRIRAALDVTDPEPLPDGHPLWSMPGVLITPHVAGDVSAEEDRAWALIADQAGRLARGEPLRNVVTDGY
jgi:phosphoglycerate dehydrogenase-like enzyme